MSQHYLHPLFSPQSVAVIGASERPNSVGEVVFRNMQENGYKGRLYAVNSGHDSILGQACFASIDLINEPVDLAVICTPASTIPAIMEACGKHGVKAAVVLSAGFSETGAEGAALERQMLANAKKYDIRMIGPNCLGVMNTHTGLNATFFKGQVKRGKLALVSQSGALCTAILDYAPAHDISFSNVVSMGASSDIDFGEVLDYLASDPHTESILIYIEGIHKARQFMSALRAAARSKPVFVIKVGRHEAGSRAARSHTGAMVGADDVFDAAIRRAGAVRVMSIGALFSAAQTLASNRHYRGNRLAIITNGGGPGVMAIDRAVDLGVGIAEFSDETIAALNAALPATWSHNNPVDIIGDATPTRYRDAVNLCLQDANVDGALVILTPQAMTNPLEVAHELITIAANINKPLLTCWMGFSQIAEARVAFAQAKIPTFRTPEAAVEAFSYITDYYRNQQQLAQTPGPMSHHAKPELASAQQLIKSVLAEGRKTLTEMESKALLAAFKIPVVNTAVARSAVEALLLAEQIGFPIVMKINSADISHKSDVGGVKLNIANAAAVRSTYKDLIAQVKKLRPNAVIDGVSIEAMTIKPNGRELMLGVTTDPLFGPIITFGAGGTTVEIMADRALALPPLNGFLVKEMIHGTRVSKLLSAFRQMPPVSMDSLETVLLRVSEMVCELPWIREMDINPLIVDENGAIAVDARVMIDQIEDSTQRYDHMAIHPYPSHLISEYKLSDGTLITIRPIRPEDAKLEKDFVSTLSEETKYFRFMNSVSELTQDMVVKFTQIDYDREMAFVAVTQHKGVEVELGVCRYAINPDGNSCEFALVVSDAWHHRKIGKKLMNSLCQAAQTKGLKTIEGDVLANNADMLKLVKNLGFIVHTSPEDPAIKRVVKLL